MVSIYVEFKFHDMVRHFEVCPINNSVKTHAHGSKYSFVIFFFPATISNEVLYVWVSRNTHNLFYGNDDQFFF